MIAVPPAAVVQAGEERPVRAIVERTAAGVRVRVVARSHRAVSVRYTLTAASHGNRATQGGSAALQPDRAVTMLDLTQTGGPDWSGTLEVAVDRQPPYRVNLKPAS